MTAHGGQGWVQMETRLRAASHEISCRECRVTWRSWAERLLGLGGFAPPMPTDIARHRVEAARAVIEDLHGRAVMQHVSDPNGLDFVPNWRDVEAIEAALGSVPR